MKRIWIVMMIILLIHSKVKSQISDSLINSENEKLEKWELGISFNTPEPLTVAGFDNNALTQRIFINGHRKEHSFDFGLRGSIKIRESLWLQINLNYAFYKVFETRDFREFYPPLNEYGLDTLSINQNSLEIVCGLYKRFQYQKIQLDVGNQFRIKMYSSIQGLTSYSNYDSSNNFLGKVIYDQSEPGGYAVGAGPFIRINYILNRKITLGANLGSYLSYYQTGGTITVYKTNIYSWGGSETGLSGVSQQTFQGFRFAPVFANLQLSYSFCNP